MRPLVAVPAEPVALLPLLRDALAGVGPALLPVALGAPMPEGLPGEVPSRVAVVIETSGSAGTPKRVALSTNALLAAATATEAAVGGPGTWILSLPAHYIAGLQVLVRSIASDRDPILLPPGFSPSDYAAALRGVERDRRYGALVPAQLARLVDAADEDPRLARDLALADGILIGGQRTPASVFDRAQRIGLRAVRTYGSSETAGGVVYDGAPIGGAKVRIEDGEVWLSGPTLAEEYLGDPERTLRSFPTEVGVRWYRTGDDGILDEGVLSVTGRRDDVIISGGEKVSLGAVERVVRELPGLHDAVVVGAADARWGEVPILVSNAPVDFGAVKAAVTSALGRAAAPDALILVDQIPMLPSGKPDRRCLASELADRPVIHVAALFVTDPDGRALLVRKAGTDRYMQPGGKPEPGESPVETAVRELAEEVGVVVPPSALTPLGRFRSAAANEGGHDVVADCFAVIVPSAGVEALAEIEEAVWVTRSEAAALPLAPLTRVHFLDRIGLEESAPRIGA